MILIFHFYYLWFSRYDFSNFIFSTSEKNYVPIMDKIFKMMIEKNLLMPKDTTKNIVSNDMGMCIFISYSFRVMLILSHFLPHL